MNEGDADKIRTCKKCGKKLFNEKLPWCKRCQLKKRNTIVKAVPIVVVTLSSAIGYYNHEDGIPQ